MLNMSTMLKKPYVIILLLALAAGDAYANKLASVLQKFPTLRALAVSTVIMTCSISGCLPKAVDSWLRGTRTSQAQAKRIAIGIDAADADEKHVFGYSNGYFVGEIIATGESYHTIRLYKHGRSRQIPIEAVEAELIVDHPGIGAVHDLPTDVVGLMHLRGEVVGVYRYLEYADTLIYVYYVEEGVNLVGEVQPHEHSIFYRNVRTTDEAAD